MAQEPRINIDSSEQNGNHLDLKELTLPEEAAFLIRFAFEEFEEIIMNYPHHTAYCFAAITRLAGTNEDISVFARRLGMWIWMEVLAFQIEEPLSLKELAQDIETDVKTVLNGIDELVEIREFDIEWKRKQQIKLVPRMTKETVAQFAEHVISGIEAGQREAETES